jgi:sulfonate transport system substrate-binding protein
MKKRVSVFLGFITSLFLTVFTLSGCGTQASPTKPSVITLDYAYYNPVSLLLKDKGWVEQEFAKDGIQVKWVESLGSNKALELLRSSSTDFGSTAGAASLVGKANGNPIKAIYVYSKPEWTALVTKDKTIHSVTDLKGKRVAATIGTDPYIFLLRALDKYGLGLNDIKLVPLQHQEGETALEKGEVDAWAGLDPYMAQAELQYGNLLFYRNPEFNTYGILNVRESFANQYPEYVVRVLKVYEKARIYALQHPDELEKILVKEAKLTDEVAKKELERTDLQNPSIGPEQIATIKAAGDVLKKSGTIKENTDIDSVVSTLVDTQYLNKAQQN